VELLPLFPLELVLLPGTPLPLHIFEPRYKELVRTCLSERTQFGVIRAADGGIVRVGCTAEIVDVVRTYPDGRMDILAMGRQRFAVHDVDQDRAYLRGDVEWLDEEPDVPASTTVVTEVLALHLQLLHMLGRDEEKAEEEGPLLSYRLASVLPIDLDFKQGMLEMRQESERLSSLLIFYRKAIPKLQAHKVGQKKSSTNGWVN